MTDDPGAYGGVLLDGAVPRSGAERVDVLLTYAEGLMADGLAPATGLDDPYVTDQAREWSTQLQKLRDDWHTYSDAEVAQPPLVNPTGETEYPGWSEMEDEVIGLVCSLLPDPWYCTLQPDDPGTVVVTDAPTEEEEPGGPVTILAIAAHRLGRTPVTGGDFEEAGLAIMGGCAGCGATLAAYNAYPSTDGYWHCSDCIGDTGYPDAAAAVAAIFEGR